MDNLLSQASSRFAKVIEVVRNDLATIRTGKATPALIEQLPIEAYGSKMKLLELATIVATDPSSLSVTPFDPGNTGAIVKGITDANLGLSAHQDDHHVRVVVPPLSAERRQEYVKLAQSKGEGGKVMVRQIRHDTLEDLEKEELDEDSKERMKKDIQKLTDEAVEKIDLIISEKEEELLKV